MTERTNEAAVADEWRMFTAEEIRDHLAETTDLDYGARNRLAWERVDELASPPTHPNPEPPTGDGGREGVDA